MSNLSQFVSAPPNPSTNLSINLICTNQYTFCRGNVLIASDSNSGCIDVPGCFFSGGHIICKSNNTVWVVSPRCSEVSRTWDLREDVNVVAQSCTGISGWFVPTCGQLQNPGYICRQFWDLFSSAFYWSSTGFNAIYAWNVLFTNSATSSSSKTFTRCVRAFRCVTY